MRGALLIAKKEFLELSKDRKTMFFAFVVPFLLFPAIFGTMAKMGRRDADQNRNRPSRIQLVDPSGALAGVLKADPRRFEVVEPAEGSAKQALLDQRLDLIVEVDPQAAEALRQQRTFTVTATEDKSEEASLLALKRLKEALQPQERAWVQARLQALSASPQLAEPLKVEVRNAADSALEIGKLLGRFLPYFLMILMYQGSMQHGIYATAGEKERHTLLSLMATRLPRNQIILGKLIYIFTMGVIAALLNILSLAVSITLIGGGTSSQTLGTVAAIANPATLGLTFLIMVPLGLFFANFILLMGVQAKNSMEAGTAVAPGIFLVIFLGVFMMSPGVEKISALSYVPVVNVCLALRKLFSQQSNWLEYWVSFAMTVGLAGFMTWLSTRLLNREKALFNA